MKRNLIILLLLCLQGVASNAYDVTTVKDLTKKQNTTLSFRENKGQIVDQHGAFRSDIQFQVVAGDLVMFVGNGQLHYQFRASVPPTGNKTPGTEKQLLMVKTYRMDVSLIGANINAHVITENMSADIDNYYQAGIGLSGACGVHTYKKVTYKDIYPNIDWVLYTTNNQLEYDFVVRPGGRVSDIRLKYEGNDALDIVDGALSAHTPMGTINEHKPYSYTTKDKNPVTSSFVKEGDNVIAFNVAPYQGTLVIDPVLTWVTYYGGRKNEANYSSVLEDMGISVTTNKQGYIYMAGNSESTENIATTGSFQEFLASNFDVFVVKFDSTGNRIWGTYYGDVGDDLIGTDKGISCDNDGNLYVAGTTQSHTGLGTPGSFHSVGYDWVGTVYDAFIAKFNANGERVWGTYYGGNREESRLNVLYNESNNRLYIAGTSNATDSIATPGTYQPTQLASWGNSSGFLVCFDTAGHRQWGTYYGGTGIASNGILSMTSDRLGNIYVGGIASTDNGIATPGSYMETFPGNTSLYQQCAFLAKFNNAGVRQWGTYYSLNSFIFSLTCDDANNVYATGYTTGAGVSSPGADQVSLSGGQDAFLLKFNSAGVRQWGTYCGGTGSENGYSLTADGENIYLAAVTSSSDIGITSCAYQKTYGGASYGGDGYIAQYNANGQKQWSSYYGGSGMDAVYSLATGKNGNIYFGGLTESANNIALGEHLQQDTLGGQRDAFLGRIRKDENFDLDVLNYAIDTVCAGSLPPSMIIHNNGPGTSAPGATVYYRYSSGGHTYTVTAKYNKQLASGKSDTLILDTVSLAIGTYQLTAYVSHLCNDMSATNDTLIMPLIVTNSDTVSVDGITAVNTGKNEYKFNVTNARFVTDYIWDFGDNSPAVHGPDPSHTYAHDGFYTVKLTANNRCTSDTASMTVQATQRVNGLAIGASALAIYPNPAKDVIAIQNGTDLQIQTVRIYNSVGALVNEVAYTGQSQIAVGNLASGLYFVAIQTDKGNVMRKLEVIK